MVKTAFKLPCRQVPIARLLNVDEPCLLCKAARRRAGGRRDRGEAAAGNRPDSATRILHDLGLLIGIEPRRRADDKKASGFESVLTDVSFRLLRE